MNSRDKEFEASAVDCDEIADEMKRQGYPDAEAGARKAAALLRYARLLPGDSTSEHGGARAIRSLGAAPEGWDGYCPECGRGAVLIAGQVVCDCPCGETEDGRRPATEAERRECSRLGCGPLNWEPPTPEELARTWEWFTRKLKDRPEPTALDNPMPGEYDPIQTGA